VRYGWTRKRPTEQELVGHQNALYTLATSGRNYNIKSHVTPELSRRPLKLRLGFLSSKQLILRRIPRRLVRAVFIHVQALRDAVTSEIAFSSAFMAGNTPSKS
jgi:hypothetical protein